VGKNGQEGHPNIHYCPCLTVYYELQQYSQIMTKYEIKYDLYKNCRKKPKTPKI